MGAFELGWMQGERRTEERRADKEARRQAELGIAENAGLTPEAQLEYLRSLYAKDPSAFKTHVQNLLGHLVGRKPQPTPDAYPAQSATVSETPLQVGDVTLPAPPATTVSQPGARTQADRRAQILSGGKSKLEQQKELLAMRQTGHPMLKEYVSPDGKQRQWFDALHPELIPEGWQATVGTSGVPRVLPPLSMSAAKKMAGMGIQFIGADGEPIDPNQFDDALQIVPVVQGDRTTYRVTSQGQTHLTVGNEVYAVPKLNQTDLSEKGVPLGQAKVGSTSTRQAIAVDPATGQAVKQELTSTTTPRTSGVRGGVTQPQAVPPAAGTPAPRSAAPKTPAKSTGTAAPATAPAGGQPAFMTPAMYNQQLQVARPLRVAANQIFGDPTQPEFKGLESYGDVMANPKSVAKIGAAARLMINDMASVEATKSGGLWTLLTTSAGLPQALAQVESEQTRKTMATLSPREQELLNAEMDAYGSIIGLRAITKGSAAKFSAQSLEREVPIPGISAFNAYTFYDKLARLGEEVWSGTKGNAVLPPEEKNYYQQKYHSLLQLRDQSKPKRKVGDTVTIGGKQKHITAVHPDGSFDAE